MKEIKPRPVRSGSFRRRSKFRSGVLSSAVATPQINWASLILDSLPQEPPKNLGDVVWNSYKDDLWRKHKPDSLILFELFRLAARDPGTSDTMKILTNILAGFCVLDGYGATVEGLREEKRATYVGWNSGLSPHYSRNAFLRLVGSREDSGRSGGRVK